MNDPYLQLKIISLQAELYLVAKECRILGDILKEIGPRSDPSVYHDFFQKYARMEQVQLALKALGVNEEYTKV